MENHRKFVQFDVAQFLLIVKSEVLNAAFFITGTKVWLVGVFNLHGLGVCLCQFSLLKQKVSEYTRGLEESWKAVDAIYKRKTF